MHKVLVLLAAMTLLIGMMGPAAANNGGGPGQGQGTTVEHADVYKDQGTIEGDAYDNAAQLRRGPNGIQTSVQIPTPEAEHYPPDLEGGHPEAFTLWVFVRDPHQDPAGSIPQFEDWTGAFLGGGHVVGGPHLTLSRHITPNTEPFAGNPLVDPQEAEVHFAVAPHGQVNPELLPDQIKTSPGAPSTWWHAPFNGDSD